MSEIPYYSVTFTENGEEIHSELPNEKDRQRLENGLALRTSKRPQKAKKKNATSTTEIVPNVPKPIRTFDSWKDVPREFKSRIAWLRAGRRVSKMEKSFARVVYPTLVEASRALDDGVILLDEFDDMAIISDGATPLFHESQTVPYQPRSRTVAYWAFEDIFFKYARKDSWIRRTDFHGEETDDWITEFENPYAQKPHESNRLIPDLIRRHINQRAIIGVKGGEQTRFVIIDLDFHGRDRRLFEAQAEVLLDKFHGVGTWHYQVKRHDVTGIQFIYVFQHPQCLKTVVTELRSILEELDAQHPDLAERARMVGATTLANVEIYPTPNNGNGVRLPLCRDREMLLDKPMPLIAMQKRQVQDVERYIAWLNDPNRQYMPKEKILDYLWYFSFESDVPKKTTSRQATFAPKIDDSRWRKNMKRWLYEFWVEGNANNRPLNEHIAVLSRLAAVQGYSETEIIDRISKMVKNLPECAKSCSSRLLKGKFRQVESVVRSTANYACRNNGHQRDPDGSTEIFFAALCAWPDFDALNTSTWSVPVGKMTVIPHWTDEQRRRLCAFFRRPLFVKDDDLILRFLAGIVNLTLAKEKEGSGWGKEYLMTWMKSQFPEIKCAKDEKRQRILKCLEAEGIIEMAYRGRAGMYATHWRLGPVAKQALGPAEDNSEAAIPSIPETPQQVPPITSTYYSSLFSDTGLAMAGCGDVPSPFLSSGEIPPVRKITNSTESKNSQFSATDTNPNHTYLGNVSVAPIRPQDVTFINGGL